MSRIILPRRLQAIPHKRSALSRFRAESTNRVRRRTVIEKLNRSTTIFCRCSNTLSSYVGKHCLIVLSLLTLQECQLATIERREMGVLFTDFKVPITLLDAAFKARSVKTARAFVFDGSSDIVIVELERGRSKGS